MKYEGKDAEIAALPVDCLGNTFYVIREKGKLCAMSKRVYTSRDEALADMTIEESDGAGLAILAERARPHSTFCAIKNGDVFCDCGAEENRERIQSRASMPRRIDYDTNARGQCLSDADSGL